MASSRTLEMNRNLCQTIDNSLEEGQFEIALIMLDQMRAPYHRPSTTHLLHLLFLSLHPTMHTSRLDDPTDNMSDNERLMQSPKKLLKQAKQAVYLTGDTVKAAHRLLFSFLTTNGVDAFENVLPAFAESSRNDRDEYDSEYAASPVYNQTVAIRNARNVWEILKPGYIIKVTEMFGTPKGKGKQSKSKEDNDNREVVGRHSWFLLEWLVSFYEKDAEDAHNSGLPKHSPSLLKQLPPPPIGATARWDASEALKVTFYAFNQKNSRHRQIGIRLLILLIDLTLSNHLSLPALSTQTLTHLSTSLFSNSEPCDSTPSTPKANRPSPFDDDDKLTFAHQEALTSLFSLLPSTPPILIFKITLCRQILGELNGGQGTANAYPEQTDFTSSMTRSGLRRVYHAQASSNTNAGAAAGNSNNAKSVNGNAPARPRPKPKAKPKSDPTKGGLALPIAPTTPQKAPALSQNILSPPISATSSTSITITTTPTSSTPSTTSISTSLPAPASAPPPHPLPLVHLHTIAPLLFLNPQAQAPEREQETQYSYWTHTPSLLLRVKFELLMSWIGVWTRRRESEREGRESRREEKDTDGGDELEHLIEVAFGVEEHKKFYRDTLRAFAGLSIDLDE